MEREKNMRPGRPGPIREHRARPCMCVRGKHREGEGEKGRGGGRVADVPPGQVFHTSSFTRPTVVSGSNAIDLRRPETSKNCTSVWGTCGTTTAAACSTCSDSSSGCGTCAGAPSGRTTSSPASLLSPAAVPGRVLLSTRVNEVRVLAGSAAISTGTELANVGRETLRSGEVE
jgi:hypothetical protein